MKKRTIAICAGMILLGLTLSFSACGPKDSGKDAKQQDTQNEQKLEETEKENEPEEKAVKTADLEHQMTAVYLTDGKGSSLFVELITEMPFVSTVPEGELYDEDGSKITAGDLKSGDVLELTGNGVIAESYPAQYHGVSKMQRTEKENEEYADKYQSLLDQFTYKPDPKEVPYLDVAYKQPEAFVTAVVETGTYTWSYGDENGETITLTADCADILDWHWEESNDVKIDGNTELELLFDKKPEKIEVVYYPASDVSEVAEEQPESAKSVEVKENKEGNLVMTAEPDFVYRVIAYWENGEVQYGFRTAQIKNSK